MTYAGEDAQMIAASASSFFDRLGGVARARLPWSELDRSVWKEMADLGWIGMLAPESACGLAMGVSDTLVLMEIAGQKLLREPLAAAVGAAAALADAGSPAADARLGELISGHKIYIPVGGDALRLEGGALVGTSGYARDLIWADGYLLLATGSLGEKLYLLPRDAAGCYLEQHETVDGATVGRLILTGARESNLQVLASDATRAVDVVRRASDLMNLCEAAILVGAARSAFDLALAHLKTRKQFGRVLGSFQALQHRAASVHVAISGARAYVHEAARAVGALRQSFACKSAKRHAAEVAVEASKEAIQFLGAIGFAAEHDVGLYLKKAQALLASTHSIAPALTPSAPAASRSGAPLALGAR